MQSRMRNLSEEGGGTLNLRDCKSTIKEHKPKINHDFPENEIN